MGFKNLLRVFVLLTLGSIGHGYLFDIIGNVTLEYMDGSQPFMTKTMNKACECRTLCIVQLSCMAFSVRRPQVNSNPQWLCKLFINETQQNPTNPKKYKLVPAPNTYLAVRSVHPNIILQQDGFYYALTSEQTTPPGSTSLVIESIALCKNNFPSFELVNIKRNASLNAVLQFINEETPIAINMFRVNDIISIGFPAQVPITETELCDYNPTCDLIQTDRSTANDYEDYGFLKGKFISVKYGNTTNIWEKSQNTFKALCQADYLHLEN